MTRVRSMGKFAKKKPVEKLSSVIAEEMLAGGPSRFTVYYMMEGTQEIHHDTAIGVVDGHVIFEDGCWNPVEQCYFTADQCRIGSERKQVIPVMACENVDAILDAARQLKKILRANP